MARPRGRPERPARRHRWEARGRRWWPAPPRSRDASAQFLSPDTNDPDFTTSTSTALSQTVSKASTIAAVLSSANPSVVGQSVTFTTTISVGAPGGGTPTGTVTFKDGTTTLATATLSGGLATYTTSTLSVGTRKITVVYAGDSNFVGSTEPVLKRVVNSASLARLAASSVRLVDGAIAALPNEATDAAALPDLALG